MNQFWYDIAEVHEYFVPKCDFQILDPNMAIFDIWAAVVMGVRDKRETFDYSGRFAKWLRRWFYIPLFGSSNLSSATNYPGPN